MPVTQYMVSIPKRLGRRYTWSSSPPGLGGGMKGVRLDVDMKNIPKPMMNSVTRILIDVITALNCELNFIPMTRMVVTSATTISAIQSWETPDSGDA